MFGKSALFWARFLFFLASLQVIIAMWWWALLGMRVEVGRTCFITTLITTMWSIIFAFRALGEE